MTTELQKRVERKQRNVENPTQVVVTIKGRTILFESEVVPRLVGRNRTVYRTTMMVDESEMVVGLEAADFEVYQASMAVALLRSLPDEET